MVSQSRDFRRLSDVDELAPFGLASFVPVVKRFWRRHRVEPGLLGHRRRHVETFAAETGVAEPGVLGEKEERLGGLGRLNIPGRLPGAFDALGRLLRPVDIAVAEAVPSEGFGRQVVPGLGFVRLPG